MSRDAHRGFEVRDADARSAGARTDAPAFAEPERGGGIGIVADRTDDSGGQRPSDGASNLMGSTRSPTADRPADLRISPAEEVDRQFEALRQHVAQDRADLDELIRQTRLLRHQAEALRQSQASRRLRARQRWQTPAGPSTEC